MRNTVTKNFLIPLVLVAPAVLAVPAVATPATTAKRFHVDSSCAGYETDIRRGAAHWQGRLVEGGGFRVSCQEKISCAGIAAAGCWTNNQILLAPRSVPTLLALVSAHEFGHSLGHLHSSGCADWNNVMGTPLCPQPRTVID